MTHLDHFDVSELLALAKLNIENNALEDALLKLKAAHEREEGNIIVAGELARLYAQLGLTEHAKPLFAQIVEKQPDALTEHLQYGMVHLDNGDIDSAITIWDNLLEIAPQFPPAQFYKGLALAQQGNTLAASELLEDLMDALDIDNLYYNRSKELLQDIGRRQNVAEESNFLPQDPYSTKH